MDKQNLILNIFFTIVFVLAWSGILFVTFLLWLVSDVFRFWEGGMLAYIFAVIYILAFVLPIIFRKRISKYLPLPLALFVSAIFSVIIVIFVFGGVRSYISSFTPQKWNNNERLRIYMIDDLEKNHQITGKTEEEIIELIGKPTYIYDDKENTYEYFIGFSMIDEIGYQIEFEDAVAKSTKIVEH